MTRGGMAQSCVTLLLFGIEKAGVSGEKPGSGLTDIA